MTIDLERFTQKKSAIVPVVGGRFQFNRKKYRTDNVEDGWYNIDMEGNRSFIGDRAFVTDESFDKKMLIAGYVFNSSMIFQNFDVGRRKTDLDVQAPLAFNSFDSFSSIRAVYWEDKRLYPVGVNYSDMKVMEVKAAYDADQPIDTVKGLTPELRMVYALHLIERQKIAEELRQAEEKKQREEFLQTIPGRLSVLFERAGGQMINYRLQGRRAIVDWRLPGAPHDFNSVIDLDTMGVIEAGYCMSGEDKKHSITSMVMTAQSYEDQDLIYVTRR